MSWPFAILAAVCGYFIGSISFATIVGRILGRGAPLEPIKMPIPESDRALLSDAVSATTIRLQYGARFGCLTSVLDMAKAAAVTLGVKLLAPEQPLFLVAAGMTVVGHIWPFQLRFRGGRGQSPIIGSLFVIDWPSALIVFPAAQILGVLTRTRPYTARFGPEALLTAWFWYRFASLPHVLFAAGLFVVRLLAMRREIAQFHRLRKQGNLRSLADEFAFLDGSSRIRLFVERLTPRWSSRRRSVSKRD
ncbi:glycerol-3-phosphate acyltransferase [Candidatus Bipolaricaulota bacterium]|nr:glycerol-3-phosphate acyltransferase [Candidatus Bipolaricaulota bacterium]